MSFQDRTHGSFTAVGDTAVEKRISEALEAMAKEIAAVVPPQVIGVYLGGGYGRGEGGIFRTPDGESHLYNDMDFFVIREEGSSNQGEIDDSLTGISRKWTAALELDVDFSSSKTQSQLVGLSRRLMYQELRRGHCLIYGKPGLLDCIPELPAEEIPYLEALRLLLNRGMGLLFAAEKLASPVPKDIGFILRNLHKAAMGSGDALMMSRRQYRWTARERLAMFRELVKELDLPVAYLEDYVKAIDFKFRPTAELPAEPLAEWQRLRDFWCDCVRRVAGVEKDSGESMCSTLRQSCRSHGESTFRQMARHCVRGRTIRPALRLDCTPPEALLLGKLYGLMEAAESFPRRERKLYKGWLKFN